MVSRFEPLVSFECCLTNLEITRIWEAIQRIDKLVRSVEDQAADAITIARLLAKNPNYRGNE